MDDVTIKRMDVAENGSKLIQLRFVLAEVEFLRWDEINLAYLPTLLSGSSME